MNFQDKQEVKKGNIGECIVDKYLISKGVIPYKPTVEKAHPFDRLCASSDKKSVYIVEVKAKARRKYYPDTGFNLSSYNDYINMQNKYGLSVFVFFVDEEAGQVYGGSLKEISIECCVEHGRKSIKYPLVLGKVIYFPVCKMRVIKNLKTEDMHELKKHTTKKQFYLAEG
jgi:hypothetical protein